MELKYKVKLNIPQDYCGLTTFLEAADGPTLQKSLLWHLCYKPNTTVKQSRDSKNCVRCYP